MRMLVQREPEADALPFVLEHLKRHIRISDDDDNAAIETMGLTAAAEIEHAAQIALLHQTIYVTVIEPEDGRYLRLPIGPVRERPTVATDGHDFTEFGFVPGVRPMICWGHAYHARQPRLLTIEYRAGFGATSTSIPHDLSQALMDQAALHYDGRSPMDAKSLTASPHMARIAARYRGVAV
ncbi:hypothetical protein LZ190_13920 [Rhodovulum sulfidophilum]|nr:hypothetical protein [Rhodovulum sulfidophilum]